MAVALTMSLQLLTEEDWRKEILGRPSLELLFVDEESFIAGMSLISNLSSGW